MVHLNMKRINAYFFKLESGNEPVREWLMDLPKEDKKIIGADIKLVEYGWPIGMPVCKPLGGGLYEVRSNISQKTIARVIFCIEKDIMILLHAFIKKSQKTPEKDLALARNRKRILKNG